MLGSGTSPAWVPASPAWGRVGSMVGSGNVTPLLVMVAALGALTRRSFCTICCTATAYLREVAAGVPGATAVSTLTVTTEIE